MFYVGAFLFQIAIFVKINNMKKREKEIREYANLFNEAYAKTGNVNESIKHVWRTKKPM
jgi:hypothetical protein